MNRRLLLLAVAAVVAAALAGCGGGGSSSAPAFSSKQLAGTPSDDWITNGGSIWNQRYSSDDEIDTSNVARLKGIWHVHLNSGLAAKYSGEAQPLVYKNVIYIVTGADDVFAIDARTGATKWKYRAQLNPKITTVCCGWTNRGVALGDGNVYLGRLDGKLVALDADTGKLVWSTQVAPWQDGYTITSAPLYYDGRVYTGLSGGEYRIRGRVTAFDAKTGKQLWRFYTIPGPGQVGHDTWPQTGDAWQHGGAPVWQTPAVDPKLGLLYFSTGNAAPDLDGTKRAGDNLFTASIVAIDAKTGKYRWHFQEVHHDIWDYDATSPVVLFDVKVNGKVRHGIAQPSKTGWLYAVDRETGRPLYGIDERPVPQSAAQHTSKTQPFPTNPPFIPHQVSPAGLKAIEQAAAALGRGGEGPMIVKAPIFTPPGRGTLPAIAPGPQGGTNWPPTSYNPMTQMFYVCAQAGSSAYAYGTESPKQPKPGQLDAGSVFAISSFSSPGVLSAIDARSGRIAWQQHWADSCYSGSATTGGNLVFVGRNGGQLQAYNATTGRRLWSFQTGAGANSTASVFALDGKEVVAFYAAGNALAGTAHGDSLWLFGLDGKLGPAKAAATSGAAGHAGEKSNPAAKTSTVNVAMTEFKFALSTQTVRRGTITFKLVNKGSIVHDFAIAGKQSPNIQPGKSGTLTVTFTKAGRYPYICTIPGHAAAGMKGVLRVG